MNPRLIWTSITPFGQSGPYAHYRASDLVGMAMGGLMSLCGDADRPPVRMRPSQAYLQAGLQAAVGTLLAHHYRVRAAKASSSMSRCSTPCRGPLFPPANIGTSID